MSALISKGGKDGKEGIHLRTGEKVIEEGGRLVEWREAIQASSFAAIKVTIDENVFPLREDQLSELQRWLRGKFDPDWLRLDSLGVPSHFTGRDGPGTDIASRAKELYEIYRPAYRPPRWALELIGTPAYEELAPEALVLTLDARADQVRQVLQQREPVNIAMKHRPFDAARLRASFGYGRAGYEACFNWAIEVAADIDGKQSPELPPNLAVFCRTPVGGAAGARVVDVVNAVCFAFDHVEQVDYRYFVLGGRLGELRAKLRDVLTLVFAAAAHRRSKTVVLSTLGGGAFSLLFPGGSGAYVRRYFYPALGDAWASLPLAFSRPLRVGLMGHPGVAELRLLAAACAGCSASFGCGLVPAILGEFEGALFVNAWDPSSIVGNGNAADNSLNGHFGRRTAMAFLSFPPTNPHLRVANAGEILAAAAAAATAAAAAAGGSCEGPSGPSAAAVEAKGPEPAPPLPAPPGAPRPAQSSLNSKVVCVGDLHGNFAETRQLFRNLEAFLGGACELRRAKLVFLGDYCDRGPDTRAVLDWLVALKAERREAEALGEGGETVFLAGNHDLGMACYLGVGPFGTLGPNDAGGNLKGLPPGSFDATRKSHYTSGFYPHPVPDDPRGMHYQGRRWGGSASYQAAATFASYGAGPFEPTPEARARLKAAVPSAHLAFLGGLEWCHDAPLPFPPGRLVCVHAGLSVAPAARYDRAGRRCAEGPLPAAAQLEALKRRDFRAPCLLEGGNACQSPRDPGAKWADPGRLPALSGRADVRPMHPDLEGKALLVSGHHGMLDVPATVCGPTIAADVPTAAEGDRPETPATGTLKAAEGGRAEKPARGKGGNLGGGKAGKLGNGKGGNLGGGKAGRPGKGKGGNSGELVLKPGSGRIICDLSGGNPTESRPLTAVILPGREIVGSGARDGGVLNDLKPARIGPAHNVVSHPKPALVSPKPPPIASGPKQPVPIENTPKPHPAAIRPKQAHTASGPAKRPGPSKPAQPAKTAKTIKPGKPRKPTPKLQYA